MRFIHISAVAAALAALAAGLSSPANAAESTAGRAWLSAELKDYPAGEGCTKVFDSETIPAAVCDFSGLRENSNDLDVVYTVLTGGGSLAVGDDTRLFDDDSVIYVKAGTAFRIQANEGTRAVAFYSVGPAAADTPDYRVYDLADARALAKPDKNVWTPFHHGQSLVYGLYQLPLALDGDSTLRHPMDEINLVIKGESSFHMDDDEIGLAPGSIVWVSHGVGHYFNDLSEDFEVLILFHRPPALNRGG